MFPPGGGGFPGIGPTPGATALDGPPPSPTPMSQPPAGVSGGPFSMKGLAGPGGGPGAIPAGQMPPEVLTGITQSASAMGDLIDSWAQITPDQAPQLALIKDMVQQYLASLMGNGAGPTTPTASGPAFPGGGMDRGFAGAGSV
jgi:hypothetical protein